MPGITRRSARSRALLAAAFVVCLAAQGLAGPFPPDGLRSLSGRTSAVERAPGPPPPILAVPGSKNGLVVAPGQRKKLKVKLTDRAGNPLAGVDILFVAPEAGATGRFEGADPATPSFVRARTNAKGLATARFVTNDVAGVFLVEAFVIPEATGRRKSSTTFAISNGVGASAVLGTVAARRAVEQQLLDIAPLDDTLQVHGPVLLPAGARVVSVGPTPLGLEPPPIEIDAATWFFWIDNNPGAAFSHPTRFVLLDASDPSPDLTNEALVSNELWWPEIALSASAPQAALLPPLRTNESVTEQLVPDAAPAIARDEPQTDACAVVVCGPPEISHRLDALKLTNLFTDKLGLPASNIFSDRTHSRDFKSPPANPEQIADLLAQARARQCSKLYFAYVGHGFPSTNGEAGIHAGNLNNNDRSTERDLLFFSELADLLEPFGQDGTEICIIISACLSGNLIGELQGRGLTGTIVTATDASSLCYFNDTGGFVFDLFFDPEGQLFVNALVKGFSEGEDTNGDGCIDLEEAGNFVKANPNLVTPIGEVNPNAQVATIDPDAPTIAANNLLIPFVGGTTQLRIKRPMGVDINSRITGEVVVASRNGAAPVAVLENDLPNSSFLIREGMESEVLTLRGVRDGVSPYTISFRDPITNTLFRGMAEVQVGSGYLVNPDPVRLLMNETATTTLERTGIIRQVLRPVTLRFQSADPSIATVPDFLVMQPGQRTITIPVTGRAEGSTTVTVVDTLHGVSTTFRVEVAGRRVARVTNTGNGEGSLGQAVGLTNDDPELNAIVFDIPMSDPGFDPATNTWTIQPTSPLPAITDPVTIDGTSQPGFKEKPVIRIDGSRIGATSTDGLRILAGDSTIMGLIITNFTGDGVEIMGPAGGNTLWGNIIGTTVDGAAGEGNRGNGIRISLSPGNLVVENTSSGNAGSGIELFGPVSSGNQIVDNNLGVDCMGMAPVGNGREGATLFNAPQNRFEGNVIGGNGDGNSTIGSQATGNMFVGNFVGTDRGGTRDLGNQGAGFGFAGGASNNVYMENTIAFNRFGIIGIEGTGNKFDRNAIHSNTDLGIDLGLNGVTSNDPGDGDSGPNRLQNFPVLMQATTGTLLRIRGQLNSASNQTFTIQFFATQAAHSSGFGEGQTFVGELDVQTDGSGNATFDAMLSTAVPAGRFVAATACDSSGNTSEFSRTVTVAQSGSGRGLLATAGRHAVRSGSSDTALLRNRHSTRRPHPSQHGGARR